VKIELECGEYVFGKRKTPSYEEQRAYVVLSIRDFLDGTGGDWDWDDFTSFPTGYPELDAVQDFCLGLPNDYPPTEKGGWCNSDGLRALRQKLQQLEADEHQAGS
jgi:hypothetical protein